MANISDLFKGDAGTGLAIGLGAAILTPILMPLVTSLARPLAKAAIKGGIIVYEKGREAIAEFGEVVDDLVAEAKAEVESSHLGQTGGAAAGIGAALHAAASEVEPGSDAPAQPE